MPQTLREVSIWITVIWTLGKRVHRAEDLDNKGDKDHAIERCLCQDAGAALRAAAVSDATESFVPSRACASSCRAFGADAEAQTPSQAVSIQSLVGPNVMIFDPSMPTSQIQATVDAIANQQLSNQFGEQRYALLFKPGTYGSAASPHLPVGYYTSVAGLGALPTDGRDPTPHRCLKPVRHHGLLRRSQ